MVKVRKLQHIGKQYMVNVPAALVKEKNWQKGDNIAIDSPQYRALTFRKTADYITPRTSALLEELQHEAFELFMFIHSGGMDKEGGAFSGRLGQLAYIEGKMRRLRLQLNPEI